MRTIIVGLIALATLIPMSPLHDTDRFPQGPQCTSDADCAARFPYLTPYR